MRRSTEQALTMLCAADPATGAAPSELTAAGILASAQPAATSQADGRSEPSARPTLELAPVAGGAHELGRRRPQRRALPLVAAAAVTVIALTAVGYAHHHSDARYNGPARHEPAYNNPEAQGRASASPASPLSGAAGGTVTRPSLFVPSDPVRAAAATAELDRIVSQLQVPAGAQRLDHAPVAALKYPNSDANNYEILLKRAMWWTTSSSVSAVFDYLQHNQDSGYTQSFATIAPNATIAFKIADSRTWLSADVVYSVNALDQGGVGIRADVEVGYYPSRPDWSLLTGVTSITGTFLSADPSPTTTRTTTDPTVIRAIVEQFNAGQTLASWPTPNCPAEIWYAGLTLRSGARTAATIDFASCPSAPILTVPGHGTLVLDAGYSAVKALLPLPVK